MNIAKLSLLLKIVQFRAELNKLRSKVRKIREIQPQKKGFKVFQYMNIEESRKENELTFSSGEYSMDIKFSVENRSQILDIVNVFSKCGGGWGILVVPDTFHADYFGDEIRISMESNKLSIVSTGGTSTVFVPSEISSLDILLKEARVFMLFDGGSGTNRPQFFLAKID